MINKLKLSWNVVVRNWVVYKKDFIANVSPTVADPMFILLSLGMGLSQYVQDIEGLTYAEFLAPGLIATTTLFTGFFECSYGFYIRMVFENVFKAMLTTPIGVAEVLIGEVMWVFLKGFFMSLGVALVLCLFGLIPSFSMLFFIPFIGGLLALACGAMGLVSSAYVANINQFQTVYSFLISPIYFLSGVFFPVHLQEPYDKIVQISPFHHGVRVLQMIVWERVDYSALIYHFTLLVLFIAIFSYWAYFKIKSKLIS